MNLQGAETILYVNLKKKCATATNRTNHKKQNQALLASN